MFSLFDYMLTRITSPFACRFFPTDSAQSGGCRAAGQLPTSNRTPPYPRGWVGVRLLSGNPLSAQAISSRGGSNRLARRDQTARGAGAISSRARAAAVSRAGSSHPRPAHAGCWPSGWPLSTNATGDRQRMSVTCFGGLRGFSSAAPQSEHSGRALHRFVSHLLLLESRGGG